MSGQASQPITNDPAAAVPTPAIPDYLASPNAVFEDHGVQWRYGRAPDYSKTRKVWEEERQMHHAAGSLEEMVENLVKNWEVEASFKPRLQDWRTINHEKYSFAMGAGRPMPAEHMIKVGTYNGILAPSEFYSPENSDFASSHKTFKRMMPTFAWEVLEVYSGPPRVAFRWRHWGCMKNDYVGFNDKGEKVTAKAHGGVIDIQGVTVATVDEQVRLQDVQTWMDPLEMFRQIAPGGIVNKHPMSRKVDPEAALDVEPGLDGVSIARQHNEEPTTEHTQDQAPEDVIPKHVSESTGEPADAFVPHQGTEFQHTSSPDAGASEKTCTSAENVDRFRKPAASGTQAIVEEAGTTREINAPILSAPAASTEHHPSETSFSTYTPTLAGHEAPAPHAATTSTAHDAIDRHLERSADSVHPQPKDVERVIAPAAGEAVVAAADSAETRVTHEEMSGLSPCECPFLMNRE